MGAWAGSGERPEGGLAGWLQLPCWPCTSLGFVRRLPFLRLVWGLCSAPVQHTDIPAVDIFSPDVSVAAWHQSMAPHSKRLRGAQHMWHTDFELVQPCVVLHGKPGTPTRSVGRHKRSRSNSKNLPVENRWRSRTNVVRGPCGSTVCAFPFHNNAVNCTAKSHSRPGHPPSDRGPRRRRTIGPR